jgi:putative hemolysin
MTPLLLFLLACAAVYLGAIEAAFSALMRLSLRLEAERSDRPDALGAYLDNPRLLFTPVRLLLGIVTGSATALISRLVGVEGHTLTFVVALVVAFVVVCELLLPLLIVGHDPERALGLLLRTFAPVAKGLEPVTRWISREVSGPRAASTPAEGAEQAPSAEPTESAPGGNSGLINGEDRKLLRSIVDFGDTLVREVMTPRPDIQALRDTATIGDLRALFREQEYSRFPVYKGDLDNIAGFVFVKDLVALDAIDDARSVMTLLRPVVVVPETKRVADLLQMFQHEKTQIAVVVDEYGGTAGLVTVEDLIEEIVGEIRDEYDEESEPIVDEGNGRFLFSGKVDVDEIAQRLNVQIAREGFETVGGYLLSRIGRVPAVGEQFDIDGLHVEVLDAERRRINKVRILRPETPEPANEA